MDYPMKVFPTLAVVLTSAALAGGAFPNQNSGSPTKGALEMRNDDSGTASKEIEDWLQRPILPAEEARSMMTRFLDEQLRPLPLPATRAAWLARRAALRREVLAVLGIDDLVPPKWDLALRSRGTLHREGYRIEKLTFQSYPGLTIPAVLYVPENISGRVPGIVSITGHTHISKAADYIQQRNVNLALRGCVVLSYDYYGYGERKTGDDPNHPRGPNGHGIRSFSFSRRTATALEVLDAIRALDVLVARPEVDPERIGFTGESGGSNTTYWIAAVDPRVKLAVPVSSVTTFDYWIRTDRNWDWHQRPPGIRRIADIGTLLALHAPSPLLIISSRRGTDDEEFPLDEAEKSFQWAKHVYRLLAAEDAAAHYESITAHGYQEDKRAQLYHAVERWLHPPFAKGDKELPAKVESFEDLRCGLPENNLTFRTIYAEWLKPLPRLSASSDPATQRAFLRARLGWPRSLPGVKAEKVAQEEKGAWSAEFWILAPEPGIRLPAVRIRRKGAATPLVLVPGRDRQAVAHALEAGQQVLALDLRATGELRHGEGGGTWPWLAGPPWPELLAEPGRSLSNWAWFAGRPWPGMWALDLRQAARFSRAKLSAPSVSIDAENAYGWPALLAGAADPSLIASGRVQVPWASLHDTVRARGDDALADVPGLLERLDIPQLRALWHGEVSVKGEATAPAATTSGGTFYVAPDGRPENDGSVTRPWPSIEEGLFRAGAGSTVIVKPGVYRGTIQLRNLPGATASRPTVIKSEVKWQAVIIGGTSEALNVVNCPGIVIDGFEVLGARADGISMNTDFGTVRNCWVHNNGSMGISSHDHKNVTIENNLIEFNGSHVQFHHGVYASGDHLTVRGNIVRHNAAYGLHLYPSLQNSTVINNLVHGHTRQSGIIVACPEGGGRNLIANNTIAFNAEGIAIWRGSGERIVNNIVAANTRTPLHFDDKTQDVAVEYNLFDVAPRPGTRGAGGGAHNLTGDPRFVDAARGVFWLRPDSPAIGKGGAQYAPRTDFWGRPLPAGRPPDIGAFPFVSALADERARAGWWQGWPYRFAAKAEMDVQDLWVLPEGVH